MLRKMLPLTGISRVLRASDRFLPESVAIFLEEGSDRISFQCGTSALEIIPNSGTRLQQLGEYDRMDPKIVSVFSVIESANAQEQDVLSGDNGPLLSSEIVSNSGTQLEQLREYYRMDRKKTSEFSLIDSVNTQGQDVSSGVCFMISDQNKGPLLLSGASNTPFTMPYLSTKSKKPEQPKKRADLPHQIIHIKIFDLIHDIGVHIYQLSEEDEIDLATRADFNRLLEDCRLFHEFTKVRAFLSPRDDLNPFVGYHVEYKSNNITFDIDQDIWEVSRLILTRVEATYLGW